MSKTMEIEVTRPFLHKGQPLKVGAKLTVELALGAELVSMNKAKRVQSAAPEAKPATKPVAEK